MPLAQSTSGSDGGQMRRQRRSTLAQKLRRHREQRRVGAGSRLSEVAGRGDRRVERDAGQEQRVLVARVDRGDDVGVARPDRGVAAGAARGERQGRAPGAGADDRQPRHRGASIPWAAGSSGQRGRPARRADRNEPSAQPLDPGPGDHRAVIGAERRRRRDEGEPGIAGERGEPRPQPGIGGDAAGGDEACALRVFVAERRTAIARAVDQRVADRRLDRRGEVGDGLRIGRVRGEDAPRSAVLRPENEKSQPVAAQHRAGQREAARIARCAPRARSPGRRDRPGPAAWRSCRRPRRRRRRWWCRAGGSAPTPARREAGNARPTPAAAGRGIRPRRSAAR